MATNKGGKMSWTEEEYYEDKNGTKTEIMKVDDRMMWLDNMRKRNDQENKQMCQKDAKAGHPL